jgi:hypothetical protein
MTSEIAREFRGVDLGDRRLDRRAVEIMRRWQKAPAASFPSLSGSAAELQALYRFVENEDVHWEALIAAHAAESCARIDRDDERTVLVVHDTTSFSFTGESERAGLGWLSANLQGFFAHVALALSADGTRRPLGVVGMSIVNRPRPTVPHRHKSGREYAKDPNRESLRWKKLVDETTQLLRGHAVPIHVMDREADAYELLGGMIANDERFVVRARVLDREVTELLDDALGKSKLREIAERSVPVAKREVSLSRRKREELADARRKHPARPARSARLAFAATTVRLQRSKYLVDPIPPSIDLNIVHVREVDTPAEMEPVEWLLLTTEPIDTVANVLRVVDIYRARWTIEELFKAIKTGCDYESRQLETMHALLNALAMCIPLAWQMLLLRQQARVEPNAHANTVMSEERLAILRAIARKPLPAEPSARDILLAVAALGGHIAKNGDPGWQTLRRGVDQLLLIEIGWTARDREGLPSGHPRSGG